MLCILKGGEELNKLKDSTSIAVGYFRGLLYDNNIPIAQIASWNEFGTETIHPRPFMRNGIRNNRKKLIGLYKDQIIRNKLNIKKSSNYVTNIMVGDIRTSLDKLMNPPNKPSTIQRKKSSHPII